MSKENLTKAKAKGSAQGTIDCKRFYLPGVSIEATCPECKVRNKVDLGSRYISYPRLNEPADFCVCCDECAEEFYVEVVLHVKLEVS